MNNPFKSFSQIIFGSFQTKSIDDPNEKPTIKSFNDPIVNVAKNSDDIDYYKVFNKKRIKITTKGGDPCHNGKQVVVDAIDSSQNGILRLICKQKSQSNQDLVMLLNKPLLPDPSGDLVSAVVNFEKSPGVLTPGIYLELRIFPS